MRTEKLFEKLKLQLIWTYQAEQFNVIIQYFGIADRERGVQTRDEYYCDQSLRPQKSVLDSIPVDLRYQKILEWFIITSHI